MSTKNNDRTNITINMIAIVHSIYSHSVHALALNAGLMDNDAERTVDTVPYIPPKNRIKTKKSHKIGKNKMNSTTNNHAYLGNQEYLEQNK